MQRSMLLARVATLAGAVVLSGCAAFNDLASNVSSFGQWPAERPPGTYVFERLPSQQTQAEFQQRLEDAARVALEAAGFRAAGDERSADVSVLLGARVNSNDPMYWEDPFWWRGSLLYGRHGAYWRGPWWGPFPPTPTYEREVALLIRDRKSGQMLYETRASNDGASPSIQSLLPAMFEAAMKDFPSAGVNPRRVVTQITKKP